MATIHSFMPKPKAARRAPAPGEAATIIIFPGVRYERPTAGGAGGGSKPQGPKSAGTRR